MVKCKAIDATLGNKYKNGIFYLDEQQAEKLQSQGKIKIVGGNEPSPPKPQFDNFLTRDNWENKRMPRVAWVMDMEKNGGAELSSMFCVDVGKRCGFDIVGITPHNFRPHILQTADIVVVNNNYHFSESQMEQIERILKEECVPFIVYSHDHRGLRYIKQRRWLYEQSKLNVFISPAHRDRYNVHNSIALPLAIDTSDFYVDNSIQRIKNSILIPVPAKHENLTGVIRKYNNKKVYIVGPNFPNAEKLPRVKHTEMRKYYNMVESVYHCPRIIGAGDRIIFEAKLCGCKVVCNDNPGHASWPEVDDLRSWLDNAPYEFWKEVSKYVK